MPKSKSPRGFAEDETRYLVGLRKIRDEARALAKTTGYASDELIAERRDEALNEEEEAVLWMRRSRTRR
jgi:hypothetical protein